MHIAVRRAGALGDVVLTTPVLARLRAAYPAARIDMHTAYPHVFEFDSRVDVINPPNGERADLFVDLDLAYERRPRMHIVRAYMQEAFDDDGADAPLLQTLFPDTEVRAVLRDPRLVVVHGAGATWRNRQRGASWWQAVHAALQAEGYRTLAVGGPADRGSGAPCIDMRGRQTLHGLWRLIRQAVCFVGSDSGPLHVAGATDTPIVGLFTCAHPAYRLPLRAGCVGLTPQLDCTGCLHDEPPPVTSLGCRRGDFACVESDLATSVAEVVDAVKYLAPL